MKLLDVVVDDHRRHGIITSLCRMTSQLRQTVCGSPRYVGWRAFGLAELEIGIGRCVLMRTSAHTASKYRWFADQCVERAQSAASSAEAVGYLQRASVWRRLADSRNNEDGVRDNRFVTKKSLREAR